jgi:putative flavoprotein involved in K+ transport
MTDVVAVIGGGPAGLAAAATLGPLGFRVRVLDQGDAVGARWRDHYDRLHLHTSRRGSALPGMAIPAEAGRWVRRDDFVAYQQRYAERHGIAVELGTTVQRVDRQGSGWRVRSSNGDVDATYVVVCTGFNNIPYVPSWPGLESFQGEVLHSRDYRTGRAYAGRRVLVVGTGNTGAEIATDLAEQGAETVWWSVRTPPMGLPRTLLGLATQAWGIVLRPVSPVIVNPIMRTINRFWIGDLSSQGLPSPTRGGYTRVLEDHVLPILDVGVVSSVRRGVVVPVPTIRAFDADGVVLSDGRRVQPDVLIMATGYRTGLDELVGHLGVLDDQGVPTVSGTRQHADAPGLYFLGYTNPLSGNLREIAAHARRLAATLGRATDRRTTQPCPIGQARARG